MSAPEPPPEPTEPWPPTRRHYWQMRHDVDDVYDLLGKVDRKVDALAMTQDEHGTRLDSIDLTLTEMRGDMTEMRGDMTEMRGDMTEMRGQLVEILAAVRPAPPES
jgi:TolA-binding protein